MIRPSRRCKTALAAGSSPAPLRVHLPLRSPFCDQPGAILNASPARPDVAIAARASACPGLLHIVPARDGGLCRIKLPGGVLLAAQAQAVAAAAAAHGNGVIEITNRANLQLRGVRPGHADTLIQQLLLAGLGPQGSADETSHTLSARDNVRNVMLSPLAGRDAHAVLDTRPLAAALLNLLQSTPAFAALSPKFSILLDGAEALAATQHAHDIWLATLPPDAHGARLAFGLAGCPPTRGDDAQNSVLAWLRPEHAAALVEALLHAFLQRATPAQARMRDVLSSVAVADLLADIANPVPLFDATDLHHWQRAPVDSTLRFGAHPQHDPALVYVGAQAPLGRLHSALLQQIANLATRFAQSHAALHCTPWQSLIIPDIQAANAPALEHALQALGLVTRADHPMAGLIACAGSAGCAKARADVKADALALSAHIAPGTEVHLSGCERSCAAAHTAAWTLLASAPGYYDVYQRAAPASDPDARFGTLRAHHLTPDQAGALIRATPHNPDSFDA